MANMCVAEKPSVSSSPAFRYIQTCLRIFVRDRTTCPVDNRSVALSSLSKNLYILQHSSQSRPLPILYASAADFAIDAKELKPIKQFCQYGKDEAAEIAREQELLTNLPRSRWSVPLARSANYYSSCRLVDARLLIPSSPQSAMTDETSPR